MVDGRRLAVLKKLANAEKIGNTEQAKRLKARLEDFPEDPEAEAEPEGLSMANKKSELLEAAAAAGVEVDESMSKAEILEALDGAE